MAVLAHGWWVLSVVACFVVSRNECMFELIATPLPVFSFPTVMMMMNCHMLLLL